MEDCNSIFSDGFVWLIGSSEVKHVHILIDSVAAQTSLLETDLNLSQQTHTGGLDLLQGVKLGVINVPFHGLYLKSDLMGVCTRNHSAKLTTTWRIVRHVIHQIVVPVIYGRAIMILAHDTFMTGDLCVNKTCKIILSDFISLSRETMLMNSASRVMFAIC